MGKEMRYCGMGYGSFFVFSPMSDSLPEIGRLTSAAGAPC